LHDLNLNDFIKKTQSKLLSSSATLELYHSQLSSKFYSRNTRWNEIVTHVAVKDSLLCYVE